jgi:hypothetical protein
MTAALPLSEVRTCAHPVYRTLVAVDIEDYGREDRTDLVRVQLRRSLLRWSRAAISQAGASCGQYLWHSTGDGYLFSIDANVPRDVLLNQLVGRLRRALLTFNRRRQPGERLRLRLAIHSGDVLFDPDPLEGFATVLTCRLLDSEVLRACLRATSQPLAAIASQVIHDGIIRHGYGRIDPDAWHRVVAQTKEGSASAWVHVPHDPAAPQRAGLVSRGTVLPLGA